MKRLFTLVSALFTLVITNAQVWNFSEATIGTYVEPFEYNGLSIVASEKKNIVIDSSNKKIDDYKFTQRLKFGGSGSAESRHIILNVDGNCTITIYGMSGSKEETRSLTIAKNNAKRAIKTGFLENDGLSIGKDVYEYNGDATKLYIFSPSGGFNIYMISVEKK